MSDLHTNLSSSPHSTFNIAVFGGAFNPPTLGHLSVIERLNHFDKVLLVPNFSHAWGKAMAEFDLRCQWVRDFIDDIPFQHVFLSDDERQLSGENHHQPITTWALLNHLQTIYPHANLTFVLGPDNFLQFSRFYRADEIVTKWSVLACPETNAIRSTQIRNKLAKNQDISHLTTEKLAKTLRADDFLLPKS